MNTIENRTVLNKAQLEFLPLLAHIKSDEELSELRKIICDYYAKKIDDAMDALWESGEWSQERIDTILKSDVHAKRHAEHAG